MTRVSTFAVAIALTCTAFAQSDSVHNSAAAKAPASNRPAATSPDQTQVRGPAPFPAWNTLKFPALRPLEIPKPAEFTMPNGMRLYLLEDHELPMVRGTALVRTGNLFDPPGKVGVAEMTGQVMRSGGSMKMTGDQMDVALEDIAASVESSIAESDGTVSFSCLRENTPRVLSIFHDVLTDPAFRQDKIDLLKTQLRSEIARRNDEANAVASREFSNIVYGRNTPYGWTMEYADVDNIHRNDLVNFYRRYYFPANVMLAVYGDFNTAEMKDRLTALFSDWTVQQPPVPKFPAVEKTPVPGVFVGVKTDVTQTFFEVGHLGGIASDKDFPALEVAGDILGGGFSSRLFRRIRENLGYAYEIYAGWEAQYDHPGLFLIGGSTQSKYTLQTLDAIRQEIEKMRTGEVTPKELQIAKDTVLNSFVFNFDRPSKTLNRLMLYKYFGYPDDFIFRFQKAVGQVTAADVLRVSREYFRPSELTIVAVGNPKDFGEPLAQLGVPVKPIDLTIPEPEKAPAAAVTAETREKGRALIEQVQKALGGSDKLAAVKDSTIRATVTVDAGGQQMKVADLEQFVAPSTLREEQTLPFGKMIMYSNGETGWVSSPRGVQQMPAPMLKEIGGEIFREEFALALSDRDPNRTVSLAAPGALNISDKSGNSIQLRIDPATHLPAALVYQDAGPNGSVSAEDDYSDWRDVSGVKVPFHIIEKHDGSPFADVAVEECKINTGLTADALGQKPAVKP